MRISVLMPTYECPEDLLYRSIQSVLQQRHGDFELIIKDGSVENPAIHNSVFLNDCIEDRPDQIKYINTPETTPADQLGVYKHNGFYQALNDCVLAATGDVLCLLCSDDEFGDQFTFNYVNSEMTGHAGHPYMVYGSCDWITRSGINFDAKRPPDNLTFEGLLKDYTLYTPAIFWNRAVHQVNGLFSEHLAWCADMDFWLRAFRRGLITKRIPRTLGRYRVWGTSQARMNSHALRMQGEFIQKMWGTTVIAETIREL